MKADERTRTSLTGYFIFPGYRNTASLESSLFQCHTKLAIGSSIGKLVSL